MRSLRLGDGVREARRSLSGAAGLIAEAPVPTLCMGLVFALLPAMVKAFLTVGSYASLLDLWTTWVNAWLQNGVSGTGLVSLITESLRRSGSPGIWITLLDLSRSLVISPLLLSALALLYNGYTTKAAGKPFAAIKGAAKGVKSLIFVALACMLAEWVVQMIPSIASGLFSLLAEMFAWIPVLGNILRVLAIILSLLISLLTDFAVVVIFCYVWICAACEGVTGFGALVRSWQLTRNAMHATIASLFAVLLLRLLSIILLGALWVFLGRPAGIHIDVLIYAVYGISACFTVLLGGVTSSLYQQRPVHLGPQPGQFRTVRTQDSLKRANID